MMSNERLGTLHLRGNASVDFFNELFRPTDCAVADSEIIDERTNSGISIREVADGYVATIDDLDLSFLEDNKDSNYSCVLVMRVDVDEDYVCDSIGTASIYMRKVLETIYSDMPRQIGVAQVA